MDTEQQELLAASALLELNRRPRSFISAESSDEARRLPKWGATRKRRRCREEQLPPAPAPAPVSVQQRQRRETRNSPTSPLSWSSPGAAASPPEVTFEIQAQSSAPRQQQQQQQQHASSSSSLQKKRKRNVTGGKNMKKPKREDVKVLYQKFQGLSDENACLKEQKAQMGVKMQTLRAEQAFLKQELKKHCSPKAKPGPREETGNAKDEPHRYLLPDLNIKLPDPVEDDENFTELPVSTTLIDCQNPILELSSRSVHAAEARKQRMVYLRSKVSANRSK